MNKTKTILAAVGGVTLVAVAAAGYFAWSAQSAKTAALEGDDESVGLETVREKADRLSRKPVYPGAESVKALTDAREAVVTWKDEAFSLASRGDRKLQPMTDAQFKEFLVSESKRLASLPAGQERKTLDAAFDFGPFKPYISEGKMPEQAALKELQRQWDDVSAIIEALSANGIDNVLSVAVQTAAAQQPKEEEVKPKKGKKAKAKAKVAEVSVAQPLSYTYVVACKTRPAALVKTLNALATSERFMAVTDMTLRREKDTIAEGLGAAEKKEEAAPTTSRRRSRGGRRAEVEETVEEKTEETPLYTLVADPASELPFDVRLTVAVYDFRTFEESKEGEVEK